MNKLYIFLCCLISVIGLISCKDQYPEIEKHLDKLPEIYPDYINVTVPVNIAPLNFGLEKDVEEAFVKFVSSDHSFVTHLKKRTFQIPLSEWRNLLLKSLDGNIIVSVAVKENNHWNEYKSFSIYVSKDKMDSYLAYRKIAPGYEEWKTMGIYQRNLTNFEEESFLENFQTNGNCMNCHSFSSRRPDCFLFHMRQKKAGTYLFRNGKLEKLNTKTPDTISSLAYPSWHPEGRFVAFSTNITKQFFHSNNRNRIEVYDENSDVLVYDAERHELVTSDLLSSKLSFENLPTFSADGKILYFCTAKACKMPDDYQKIKYSLCSISFDPQNRKFGNKVDTLYSAEKNGRSVSFPRVSPDGNYLMYTLSDYGYFTIWHKDADLQLIDLRTCEHRSLKEVNSPDVESYHSWTSNGRWFVFSSRRDDGLYTRPYIAHISAEGVVGKPFMLPQKKRDYYKNSMSSYNIPEFVSGKIDISVRSIMNKAESKGVDVRFVR